MAKTPRKYQIECLEALAKMRAEGKKKALVVMASGLGKTLTAVFDVKEFLKSNPNARVLVLCHSIDVLDQIKNVFRGEFGDGYIYGMYNNNEKATHRTDFLFANLQSVNSYRTEFDPKEFDYVIVDEAHHAQAVTYRRAITYFQPEFLLGLTATPDRMDGLDIEDIFEETVYNYSLYEAVLDGWLAKINHIVELDDLEERLGRLKDIAESGRALSVARLNREFFVPKRDEEIVEVIKKKITARPNATTVIFCQTIEHAERIAQLMNAVVVHSLMSMDERTARLRAFVNGTVKSICAVDLLNEGIDVPATNIVVFLRTTQSTRIFIQQLGRGLRKTDNKDEVLVLDFIGNFERFNQIMQMRRDFEECSKNHSGSVSKKPPYELNINTIKFEEKQVDILKILGSVGGYHYTNKELISLLKAKAKSLGRTPTRKDIVSDASMPSDKIYIYRFESWNNALKAAGFSANRVRYTDKELIRLLKMKAKHLGRTPTRRDIASDSNMPSDKAYVCKFGSWNNALKAAGFSIIKSHARYTDEELIDFIKVKAKRLGRTPTHRDINSDNNMPSIMAYTHRFKSWNNALKMAGFSVIEPYPKYTDEELIDLLKAKAKRLGCTPTHKDVDSDTNMPSSRTYLNRFGSWHNALKIAGIPASHKRRKKSSG